MKMVSYFLIFNLLVDYSPKTKFRARSFKTRNEELRVMS